MKKNSGLPELPKPGSILYTHYASSYSDMALIRIKHNKNNLVCYDEISQKIKNGKDQVQRVARVSVS